jgi:hypothetical protein
MNCPSCGRVLAGKEEIRWEFLDEASLEILRERFVLILENCPHCRSTVTTRKVVYESRLQ